MSERFKSLEILTKLDSVLLYVSDIQNVATDSTEDARVGELRNIMRPDASPSEGGAWSAVVLANAPHQKDGYVKVKQIF